jgi:hypothetical protein
MDDPEPACAGPARPTRNGEPHPCPVPVPGPAAAPLQKKKDKQVTFCFYCDRTFNDEGTLVQHQKGKHFKVRPAPPHHFPLSPASPPAAARPPLPSQTWRLPRLAAPCRAAQCPECNRKLSSARGLQVHAFQVHKLTLNA